MAKKTDSIGLTGSSETIVGTGVVAKGSLVSDTDIYIDGSFSGEIKATGNVTLGVNAIVKADVIGANVSVGGSLTGDITAEGETSIGEVGHVRGNINTGLLSISSGAIFIGNCKMVAPKSLPSTIDDVDVAVGA